MENATASDTPEATVISAAGHSAGTSSTSPPMPSSQAPDQPPPHSELPVGRALNDGTTAETKLWKDEEGIQSVEPAVLMTNPPPLEGAEEGEQARAKAVPAQSNLRTAQVLVSRLYTLLHNAGNVDAVVEGDLRQIWVDLKAHVEEII